MSINTPGHDVVITHTHASGLTIKRECLIFQLHVVNLLISTIAAVSYAKHQVGMV